MNKINKKNDEKIIDLYFQILPFIKLFTQFMMILEPTVPCPCIPSDFTESTNVMEQS